MPRIIRPCAFCGVDFPSQASRHQQTCSRSCASKQRQQQRKDSGLGGFKPKTGDTIVCESCGKTFYARKWQLHGEHHYCSQACKGLSDRKPRTIKPCGYCGKEMSLLPSHKARVYCSVECRALGQTLSWTLLERTYNGRPVKQDRKGYIWLWDPERGYASQGGWYQEHRMVVEASLGRRLLPDEHIHHVNGIKDDNRLENLLVMSHGDHARLSVMDHAAFMARVLVEWKEYRRLYGPLLPADDDGTSSGGAASGAAAR